MPREILHRTAADSRRVPWRNGRGSTEELAIWPATATFEEGGFEGRISKARVAVDGPFSAFPGFERILVVTAGPGLLLEHGADGARVRLRPLEPYRFDGGVETRAELVGGPVDDFNVYARIGSGRADVEALRLGARRTRESVGPGVAFVHVLAGPVTVRVPREEDALELEAGESAWGRGLATEEEWELAGRDPDTRVLLVRWTPSRHP